MVFPSKKDFWLVLIVIGSGILLLAVAVSHVTTRGINNPETWITSGVAILYIGIISFLAYPVYYEITPSHLLIRSGLLLRYRIPLSSIESIQPTRSPLSSPAWSLDRLRIKYSKSGRKQIIMISPKDKEIFLRHLVTMEPYLELKENMVIRK
jgi:membrane protein YdbS with pleckstrin-like domain